MFARHKCDRWHKMIIYYYYYFVWAIFFFCFLFITVCLSGNFFVNSFCVIDINRKLWIYLQDGWILNEFKSRKKRTESTQVLIIRLNWIRDSWFHLRKLQCIVQFSWWHQKPVNLLVRHYYTICLSIWVREQTNFASIIRDALLVSE